MKSDAAFSRKRLWLVLAAAAAIGLLSGQPTLCLGAAGVGLALHHQWQAERLSTWLAGGPPPPHALQGVWAALHSQIRRERRRAEQRSRTQRDLLRGYSRTANALPDAAVVLDRHRHILGANLAARTALGIDNRDRGQRIDNLLRAPALRALFDGEAGAEEVQLPSPLDDNATLRLRLISYAGGQHLLLAQDISESLRHQESRQAFAANVSHELNTPLTVIYGQLELLADEPAIDGAAKRQLRQALRQAERMRELVQDLLSLSRLESAPAPGSGEPIALAAVVQEEAALLGERFEHSHPLRVDVNARLCLSGRIGELRSVVHNLIANAHRHTPAGTAVRVHWGRDDGGGAALTVIDRGPGIAAEHLPHLTERFYRVDPARSRESGGTGLGLAIVKHVVQRHGGELRIDSRAGEGARFVAVFPAARVRARDT